jgi:hypothetical protein
VSQVVERLPSKHEALISMQVSPQKTKQNKKPHKNEQA